MIEQVNNSVVFYAFFTSSGVGALGLNVRCDVWSPAGAKIVDDAAAAEVGGGFYRLALAAGSTAAEGEYVAVFRSATAVDSKQLPALWTLGRGGIERLDAAISSRAAAGATVVNLLAPVIGVGDVLVLVPGDDYAVADDRALRFAGGPWAGVEANDPVKLTLIAPDGVKLLEAAGSVSGDAREAVVPLTAAQSGPLPVRDGIRFALDATSAGRRITLAAGAVRMVRGRT